MNWVWLAAGVAMVLAGTVFAVGAMLPREHVATRSIRLRQSPADVWKVIRNVKTLADWRTGVTKVDGVVGDDEAPQTWVEHSGKDRLKLAVQDQQAPARLVTRIDDDSLPFGGVWSFDLAEHDGGTRLRITENGFVNPAPFRFIARFLIGHSRTLEGYLNDLAAKTGNDIHIEP